MSPESIIKLSAQQLSKFCWGKMSPKTSKSFPPVKPLWLVAYLSQAWMAPRLRLASANSPCSTPACDGPHPVGTCNCEGSSPLTLRLCPGSNCPVLKSEVLGKRVKNILLNETSFCSASFLQSTTNLKMVYIRYVQTPPACLDAFGSNWM